MIKTIEDVRVQFDAIKDHKPRATKKLNELGDILASAYALDPEEANNMWQYIIDLNIADDITYSKFYVAQVFNKLTDRMNPDDAALFVGMNPDRIRLMAMYGYEGGNLWKCLNVLVRGFVTSGSVDNALTAINCFYEKFGGGDTECKEVYNVAKTAAKECAELINKKISVVPASALLDAMKGENLEIAKAVDLERAINGIAGDYEFDELFDFANDWKYPTEFFDLLWTARAQYDSDELKEKWIEYVNSCEDNEPRPYNYIYEDIESYDNSKLKFYVDLEQNTDELLEYYFCRTNLYDVERGVIRHWMENGDWDRFTKYLAQTLMYTDDSQFSYSSIHQYLQKYMDVCFYDDHMDLISYGRSTKELMRRCGSDFAKALVHISAISVGCDSHESYHEFVKTFVQKYTGNVDLFGQFGFDEQVDEQADTRSPEDQFKEYVHDFLMTGELNHDPNNTKYFLIRKTMQNDLMQKVGDEIDPRLEQEYRLACDDEIAEFYFKHSPEEYTERCSLLSSCVRKLDINRAIELIDLMAETESIEEYEELSGRGWPNVLTLHYLIDEYAYDKGDWRSEEITNEMRGIAKQLIVRIIPYLSEKSKKEIKKDLYKINLEEDDNDQYISQLLEDAKVYTTFPKPHGKGGAKNINRMSDEFRHCFERLSHMGRLDVIVEIMSMFASVKDILKPIRFETWMSFMARGIKDGDMIKIFQYDKSIFENWLEIHDLRDGDIINVARGMAKGSTREEFMEFRNLVISRKGKVDGLDLCYEPTSENTETQLLFDGETVKIDLDYVKVIGYRGAISNVAIHLLSTAKTEILDSVRVLQCKINDIEVDDCGFICHMDTEPTVGYHLFWVDHESEDVLTVYSGFFNKHKMMEVERITLQFVMMDEEANPIETMRETEIILDAASGEYKVSK